MKKAIAVLGLSKFGRSVAEALEENGAEVMIADNNDELVDQFSSKVTYALAADLTDVNSLRGLGLENMDIVIIAMSMNLEASIMCLMIAKELGVKKVIVKAKDDRMKNILLRLGADKVIQPETESGIRMARTLVSQTFLDYFELTDDVAVVDMNPKPSWVGKSLRELMLRNKYGANVLGITKNGKMSTSVDPDEKLKADDQMLLVLGKEDMEKLSK